MSATEIDFVLKKLHPSQDFIIKNAKRFNHLRCGRRYGKALVPETEIFTYNRGWITMGLIEVGDVVVSSNGDPCNVISVTNIHENEYYKVKFSTGEVVRACADHQWITHSKKERKQGGRHIWRPPSIKNTKEISETLKYGKKEYSHLVYNIKPVKHDFRHLPIHPYILGLWLGDGGKGGVRITIGNLDSDEISKLCNERGYPLRKQGDITYTFSDGFRNRTKLCLQKDLRGLGILNQKAIPQIYLTADIESRMELLRGLNDSDGHANLKNNNVEFTNTNKCLANQYFELVTGLGFKAHFYVGNATLNGQVTSKKFRICYSTNRKVFNLSRKQNRLIKRISNQSCGRSIVSCDYYGKDFGLCIQVDSPDKTYCITRSFIPTHNTTLIEELCSPVFDGWPVGIWFPTYKDLSEVWKDVKKKYSPIISKVNEQLKQIELITGRYDNHGDYVKGLIDFWSMEEPDSGQGRKYKRAIIDEAAKAGKLYQAWENTIRPTLTDYIGDAFILSRPKGKTNGFYKLEEKHKQFDNWAFFHFTTYDNPFIDPKEIEEAKQQLDEITFRQEYLAEYVDANDRPFIYAIDKKKHIVKQPDLNRHLPIIISFDFNKDPMTCLIGQATDIRTLRIHDEIKLANGSTPELCEVIRAKYVHWLGNIHITGDATGQNRTPLVRGSINHYIIIKKALGVKDFQFRVRKQNISHINSRVLCNSVIQNANFTISETCKETIMDCLYASVDEEGKLIKTAEHGRHFFDNVRYMIDATFPDFIQNPKKYSL